jgi:two-component system sensor histidine kinase/response regulator
VAEDNLVNRKLVTRLLQQRGHRITSVDNGRSAVDAIQRGKPRFDVILMDVQMPEMNGLEATAAIRRHEAASGGHVPIIALTAHAMQGDRERCLAAGMDGYLAKPIDVEELVATIESSVDGSPVPAADTTAAPAAKSSDRATFDERAALAHAGNDRSLLRDVIRFFRADYPATIRRIARAVSQQDAEAVRMHAHALKGALATVGSPAGREAAFALELLGRSGDLATAAKHLEELRDVISALEQALESAGYRARRKAAKSSTAPRQGAAAKKRRSHGQSARRRR